VDNRLSYSKGDTMKTRIQKAVIHVREVICCHETRRPLQPTRLHRVFRCQKCGWSLSTSKRSNQISALSTLELFAPLMISTSLCQKEQGRKRVSFCDVEASVIPTPSPLDQLASVQEWTSIAWYHKREIYNFRGEYRDLCLQMRYILDTQELSSLIKSIPKIDSMLLAQDDQTRGLERKTCLIRQRKAVHATRCILRAAHHPTARTTPDQLAALARKCTAWAALLAHVQGQCDEIRATATVCADVDTRSGVPPIPPPPQQPALATAMLPRRPDLASTRKRPASVAYHDSFESSPLAQRLRVAS
jgi:hypothetical protein